jgi:hypothetical protein
LNTDEEHLRWKADNDHAWAGKAEERAYLRAALRLLDAARAEAARLTAEVDDIGHRVFDACVLRVEKAEAQVAAVRALCDVVDNEFPGRVLVAFVRRVRAALDAAVPEPAADGGSDAPASVERLERSVGAHRDLRPGVRDVPDVAADVHLRGDPGQAVPVEPAAPTPPWTTDWTPPTHEFVAAGIPGMAIIGARCAACGEMPQDPIHAAPAAPTHEFDRRADDPYGYCSALIRPMVRCGKPADHPIHRPADTQDGAS